MRLLWRRRWVVFLAACVSVAAAAPSLATSSQGFTSKGQVLIPSVDPVSEISPRATSPVSVELDTYAGGALSGDVRTALGPEADELIGVAVSQQRDPAFYSISAEARSPGVASEVVEIASAKLIQESESLVDLQIQQLSERVTAELRPLEQDQKALVSQLRALETDAAAIESEIKELEAVGGDQAIVQINSLRDRLEAKEIEISVLDSRINLIESQRQGLSALIESANSARIARIATSSLISGPSVPQSTRTEQVVRTVALALLVGIIVAALMIMWLDRRRLLPPEASNEDSGALRGTAREQPVKSPSKEESREESKAASNPPEHG
jgi:hypothetical protein